MIVLDTNVISALMRIGPDAGIVAWLDAQPSDSVWITSISVFEVEFGLAVMPAGKKRQALQEAFKRVIRLEMRNRVLEFDSGAATEAAMIAAKLQMAGRPVEIRDIMIAGIVAFRRTTLATRNTKHFAAAGIPLINPWPGNPPSS